MQTEQIWHSEKYYKADAVLLAFLLPSNYHEIFFWCVKQSTIFLNSYKHMKVKLLFPSGLLIFNLC